MMWRKYHRIVSLIVLLPFALVLGTGLVLQLRQELDFIQPKAVAMERIEGKAILTIDEMIQASGEPRETIERVIFKPSKFHLALWLKDGRELQIHPQTGEILKSAPRYTNFLIELHQGSFFSKWAQYLVFFPAGLGVLFLTISGLVIYPWRKLRER